MRMVLTAVLVALVAGPSSGATKACGQAATLTPAALTAPGATPDLLNARGAPAVVFQAVTTAGTATVRIEICCTGPCDATGAWAPVENSDMALASPTLTLAKGVATPACLYRANVTACAGCSVTVPYACAGP